MSNKASSNSTPDPSSLSVTSRSGTTSKIKSTHDKALSLDRYLFDEVMVPNYSPLPMIPVRGLGSRVWDSAGKEYIDFAGGIAVTSVGHANPELLAVLAEQSQALWHVSNYMTNEPALHLAYQLTKATFAEKVFFANSGSEANEAAFKLARRYAHDKFDDNKHEIIAFNNSFHGRSLFTVSVGGQPKYSDGFGPKIAGITHLPFNNIEALTQAVSNKTCAVVMELIQGEGGVINADQNFVTKARQLCDKYNALLIIDEVQTGVGRTGTLYAYEQYAVTPDILTTAKGLGNGFPVAAMLTTRNIAKHLSVGTHGSTYGGNPMACAIASKVLDIVNQPHVLNSINQKSQYLQAKLHAINTRHMFMDTIRGSGLLLGCVLNKAWQERAPDIVSACSQRGLMLLMAGTNVVRFAPSLLISEADIDAGAALLDQALGDCA